jgi:3-deoxy-D-manno-octulosonic-acid transferase
MLVETRNARIPAVVVNGRMSERSMKRWLKAAKAAAHVLRNIDLCLTQTEEDAQRYFRLGAPKVHATGNLKFDAAAPPVDNDTYGRLSAMLGSRPVWLAASTHAGEEDIAIRVHDDLLQRWPDLTTIILPRHPERGPEIAELASRYGFAAPLRSRGQDLPRDGGLYIADTIGETGLFYRLSGISFIGRSLSTTSPRSIMRCMPITAR